MKTNTEIIKSVLTKYQNGKLKSSTGKAVIEYGEALAMALKSAGVSKSSLQRSESLNRAKKLRTEIAKMLDHEISSDRVLKKSIIEYMRGNPAPEFSHICKMAESYGVSNAEAHNYVYKTLAETIIRVERSHSKTQIVEKSEPVKAATPKNKYTILEK